MANRATQQTPTTESLCAKNTSTSFTQYDQKNMNLWSTNKLDRYNQHGAPLCHAFGCRKHKRLREAYRGLWCYKHLNELKQIREALDDCKQRRPCPEEVAVREQELEFRKWLDANHMKFLSELKLILL